MDKKRIWIYYNEKFGTQDSQYHVDALPSFLTSCKDLKGPDKREVLKFAVSADNPHFEYMKNGEITGFDIELGQLVAKELGLEATFQDMSFGGIFASLTSGAVDAGISAITITPERAQNFDFSVPYYTESIAVVCRKENPLSSKEQLAHQKISCQLGTTLEIWLKKHVPNTLLLTVDSNNQAIEMLKAGHVNAVLVGEAQGPAFCAQNPELSYAIIASADNGSGILLKKGSPLKARINAALKKLQAKGALDWLKKKWVGGER